MTLLWQSFHDMTSSIIVICMAKLLYISSTQTLAASSVHQLPAYPPMPYSMEYRWVRGDLMYIWRILQRCLKTAIVDFFRRADHLITRGHILKPGKTKRRKLYPSVALFMGIVNS